MDSSAVVAFARQHTTERLQCFTIALDGGGADVEGMVDDLPYAQRVAAHLGVDLRTVKVGPEMVDSLPEMIYHLDEPQADPAACCEFVIPADPGSRSGAGTGIQQGPTGFPRIQYGAGVSSTE